MVVPTVLGFPRFGPNRELKKAVEAFWSGKIDEVALDKVARELRANHWKIQQEAGVQHIPSNDFSTYDHVLDLSVTMGAVPERYRHQGLKGASLYYAMARGLQRDGVDVPAMEMKKWLNRNYHYIVPELDAQSTFMLEDNRPLTAFLEAKALGVRTRPVLVGPISYLLFGKSKDPSFNRLSLLDKVLPVYGEILESLGENGADWVQIDEPVLVIDTFDAGMVREAFLKAYRILNAKGPKLLVATYFDTIGEHLETVVSSGVAGVHLDLCAAPQQLLPALDALKTTNMVFSVGVIDGGNVWKANLSQALEKVSRAVSVLGVDRVFVAPSCSLLHSPHSLAAEETMEPEIKNWLAFATEKLKEIVILATAASGNLAQVEQDLRINASAIQSRQTSSRIHDPLVKQRLSSVTPDQMRRRSPFPLRFESQRKALGLPPFPSTTVGSFPQTQQVRVNRANLKKKAITLEQYKEFVRAETERCVRFQERVGLDVLVDGEFDRNDMVEFFGEHMKGYVFTKNGWVQSYGSRGVKPPIIYGDISRPHAMTVEMSKYAQSLTDRPVKGMLTGPVTMLQWSFVRDDQPRSDTTFQLALAIRDEVVDLEAAGLRIIQIDEPAIREGLPLRREDWNGYLQWAVDAFLLATTGVGDETQIHTHMCYSDFGDILPAIQRLDADVITIESSRSDGKLTAFLAKTPYTNQMGPGVYDIHSPRVPSVEELQGRAQAWLEVIPKERLWINPDCGLKTRGWTEVEGALTNMCQVAKALAKASA